MAYTTIIVSMQDSLIKKLKEKYSKFEQNPSATSEELVKLEEELRARENNLSKLLAQDFSSERE